MLLRRLQRSNRWPTRSDLVFAALLTGALAVRLGWVAATPHFVPTHDALDFDRYGISIARFGRLPLGHQAGDHGPLAYRPPGYPFFLAAIYRAFGLGHRIYSVRVIQAFAGTATVALVAATGWMLWGPIVGLVAAAIAAVYPPLVYVGESMYSEAVFLPVMLGSAVAALMFRRSRGRLRWAVAAGVLCGVGVLVRPNAAALAPALLLLVWGVRAPRLSARSLAAPALVFVCAVLVIAPWTLRNALVLHQFVPVTTELGNTMAGTYNDEERLSPYRPAAWTEPRLTPEYGHYYRERGTGDAALDQTLRSAAFRYIGRHPTYLWEVWRWNTARLLDLAGFAESHIGGDTIGISQAASDIGTVSFWALGLLAVGGLFTGGLRRAPLAFWLLPVLWYLSVVFLNAEAPRFRVGIDPFLILLAALAASAVASPVAERVRAQLRWRQEHAIPGR
jgi:4-amino-4-deoxy-L-arabinose transferase-like glycosyltransferase